MSRHKYHVPLVSHDLTPSETVLQIADALDALDRITADVFDRVEARVAANSARVGSVTARISAASSKVDALRQSRRTATAVFSSSRYPAKPYEEYESIFSGEPFFQLRTPLRRKHLPEERVRIDANDVREKLRFYHVPQTTKGSRSGWEEDDDHRTKQPVPPEALSSATSLLVYNTADNPYAGAQSRVDALDGGRKTAKRVQNSNVDEGKGALDAAPVSLSKANDDLNHPALEDLFYSPDLDDLPELDLPDVLNLPNIAQDLSYEPTEPGPGIAPSFALSAGNNSSSRSGSAANLYEVRDDVPPGVGPARPLAPPPPPPPSQPPPPPPTNFNPEPSVPPPPLPPPTIQVSQPQDPLPPPPPPPPLPQLKDTPPEPGSTSDNPDDGGVRPKSSSGGRAGLMEAIRSAGGKAEKTVRLRRRGGKSEADDGVGAGVQSSGDLLADLATKLTLRRRGIAGDKTQQTGGGGGASSGGGVMDKISAMIPLSPQSVAESRERHSYHDDDDDDWDE